MAAVLGLLAAVGYGVSDFAGGLASRRLNAVYVSLITQATSALLTSVALLVTASGHPADSTIVWGAVSGLGSAGGTLALYYGFARSDLSIVGPISSLGATVLPAIAGAAWGERPGPLQIAGIVLAIPAVWLVSGTSGPAKRAGKRALGPGAAYGLAAGVGFALIFIALNRAGNQAGLWPVATGQVTAFLIVAALAAARRPPVGLAWRPASLAVAGGMLGGTATILYFRATHAGLLIIVAVLTSLYPAVTVLLARLALRERLAGRRSWGLLLTAAAITIIVI